MKSKNIFGDVMDLKDCWIGNEFSEHKFIGWACTKHEQPVTEKVSNCCFAHIDEVGYCSRCHEPCEVIEVEN